MANAVKVTEIETPSGIARAHVTKEGGTPYGLAILGHGAGGGIDAPDLLAVTAAFNAHWWTVARVEQPYRVKGRRAPEAAPRLDAAWIAAVAALRGRRRYPVIVGGRSSGARVACRTAVEARAVAVIALAFPLHPPGKPETSRIGELVDVTLPVLVVQGERDPFGDAQAIVAATDRLHAGQRMVAAVPGDHSLRQSVDRIGDLVDQWLEGIGW